MLVLSQAVLGLQLSFAVIPLILFTSDRRKTAEFVNPAWTAANIIVTPNLKYLTDFTGLTALLGGAPG